jgi:hypothetical protein
MRLLYLLFATLVVPPATLVACGRTNLFPEDRGSIADAEVGDAGPTVICALTGDITASDEPDAGPFEVCTAEYPTCAAVPESPGFQCCNVQHFEAGGGEIRCTPNDAGAYNTPLPTPVPFPSDGAVH